MNKISFSLNLNTNCEKKTDNKNIGSLTTTQQSSNSLICKKQLNKDEVSFTGLNRTLSKRAFEKSDDIKNLSYFKFRSKGIVGNLMPELVEKIPKAERKTKITELYASLKSTVKSFRTSGDDGKAELQINNALKKAGVLNENEKMTLNYVGSGALGSTYQMKGVFGDKYLIKLFENTNSESKLHGNFIEPNRAAFWQKRTGVKTQKVRFYLADVNAGYMINKYIPDDSPVCAFKKVPEYIHGLQCNDIESDATDGFNKIRGFDIDFGGLEIISSLSQNKTASFVFKKIYEAPEKEKTLEMAKFLGMKKYRNNEDVKLGIAHSIKMLRNDINLQQYMDVLLEKPNNEIKLILNRHLGALPQEKTHTYFNKILNNSNNTVKEQLVYYLGHIRDMDQRLEAFETLSKTQNKKVKVALSKMLYSLPDDKQVEYFDKILRNTNDKTKEEMIAPLRSLKAENALECYKTLSKKANQDLKIKLAKSIVLLPQGQRLGAFDEIINMPNNEIKMTIIKNISIFSEKDLPYIYDKLLESANAEIRYGLLRRVDLLHSKVRTEYCEKCKESFNIY